MEKMTWQELLLYLYGIGFIDIHSRGISPYSGRCESRDREWALELIGRNMAWSLFDKRPDVEVYYAVVGSTQEERMIRPFIDTWPGMRASQTENPKEIVLCLSVVEDTVKRVESLLERDFRVEACMALIGRDSSALEESLAEKGVKTYCLIQEEWIRPYLENRGLIH